MIDTILNYFKSNFEELTKVVWPTKNQAIRLTIIVMIFCIVVAIFLGFIDFGFGKIYTYVINI